MALFFSDKIKIPCAFHQKELITNFCTCKNCLLPLCPLCIKIHTGQHNAMQINPQYEHINDIMDEIQNNVQNMINKSNNNYRNISEIDNKVRQFEGIIKGKIITLKNDIIKQVQDYFQKLTQNMQSKIKNMNYVKTLHQLKENAKKNGMYLKIISKNLNEPQKVMRAVIKYRAENLQQLLTQFNQQVLEFIAKNNSTIINFTVKDNYKQLTHQFLNTIRQLSIDDIGHCIPVVSLIDKLKQCTQKPQQKKQIKKSIENILKKSSVHSLNSKEFEQGKGIDVQGSIHQSENNNRRSLSRGKGLTVMQNMNTMFNNGNKKIPKISRIISSQNTFEGWDVETKNQSLQTYANNPIPRRIMR